MQQRASMLIYDPIGKLRENGTERVMNWHYSDRELSVIYWKINVTYNMR